MSDNPYIHDGYTQQGYIAPVAGMHSGLRFVFRPMSGAERRRALANVERENERTRDNRTAVVVAEKIVSWELTRPGPDRQPEPAPISSDSVLHLHADVMEKLIAVVFGMRANDPDPEAAEAPKSVEDLQKN